MGKAFEQLADLRDRLARDAVANMPAEAINRLCVTAVEGELHVDFYGTPFDEPLQELLVAVTSAEVAEALASLTLRSPDEGANGTRNWDLNRLADSDVAFPRLRELSIEQSKPTDHNRSIVASVYEEDGVLARILARAPALESLVTPSAPDAKFFQGAKRPIRFLNVDAGYDRQNFIQNLARSTCFPDLLGLEFGECNETYLEDYSDRCTPMIDYRELFAADKFRSVRRFVWRNPVCSDTEIIALKTLRPDLQLLVVRTSAEYVR